MNKLFEALKLRKVMLMGLPLNMADLEKLLELNELLVNVWSGMGWKGYVKA